jgi:pimeloyl-ACP methyl ester carboxylesterase
MATVRTSDGVTLHVTEDGEGPPVVLVAGFMAPATTWTSQAEALLQAGYRVVAVDRRSHGLSESPSFGLRIARHGADLENVLGALDLEDAVLVGGSMGASSMWAYCDLFGTARLRGTVSVDQTPKMVNGDGWEHGFYGLTHANSGEFFDAGIPVAGTVSPYPFQLAPLLRDHAQQDWRDVVRRSEVPALMVAGDSSEFWPSAHAAAAVEGNPLGRAVTLEDCGHAVNFDQPEAFNRVLLEFLADL